MREVDGGPAHLRALRALARLHRVRRAGHGRDRAALGHARHAPALPDDLPGPVREPEPALARGPHRRGAAARARPRCRPGRHRRARGRPPRGRAPVGPRRREVPARVLRGAAPEDLHREGAVLQPRVPGLRRAHERARRVGPGADPQPHEGPAARARPDLPLHLAQPRGGLAHLHARGRDVPGPHRGDRAHAHDLRAAPAPLHADARERDPRHHDERQGAHARGRVERVGPSTRAARTRTRAAARSARSCATSAAPRWPAMPRKRDASPPWAAEAGYG